MEDIESGMINLTFPEFVLPPFIGPDLVYPGDYGGHLIDPDEFEEPNDDDVGTVGRGSSFVPVLTSALSDEVSRNEDFPGSSSSVLQYEPAFFPRLMYHHLAASLLENKPVVDTATAFGGVVLTGPSSSSTEAPTKTSYENETVGDADFDARDVDDGRVIDSVAAVRLAYYVSVPDVKSVHSYSKQKKK
jgi:hypothetical protein